MSSVTAAPTGSVSVEAVVDVRDVTTSPRNFGRIVEQTWIWTVVGYSILRFAVAWGAFADHGVNVWVFGLIDIGTAWPYGKGVALVCKRIANGQWKRLPVPLAVSIASFFAPYAYIWFAAGELPSGVRVAMALFVTVLFIAASVGVIAKSRKLRQEAAESSIEIDVREPAKAVVKLAAIDGDDGLIIDLTGQGEAGELVIDLTDAAAKSERRTLRR